jgi:2,4-dienoyl-CoA reductase-like NADH-dependent reductase (Old Yellow Enzyme family)/thioredoxin reductase
MPSLLQQPGMIGPLRMKNRLLMAPMGTNFSTSDGLSTERDRAYYEERARGGVAAIVTEAMAVSAGGRAHNNSLWIYHDRFIPGLARLVEAIRRHDCLTIGQLNHRGGLLRRMVLNTEPVGPSPWHNPNTGDAVRPLGKAEIVEIQKDFVAAARRLHQAGYDAVEIHAANGYLFQQFFTARINRRSDEYGGSLGNRARLLLETVHRMRDALPDFPLWVRISCTEYCEDGYPIEEAVELARMLEAAGVDALDLSGGTNESPALSRFCIQPPSMPRRTLEPHAKPITDAVGIPTIIAGRILTPEDAEAALASGAADYVSLGRALTADPHWARKALGESTVPIRLCISCNVCFERLTLERDVACVTNPMLGTEFEAPAFSDPPLPAAAQRQRILVLGAGVGGIEVARLAAQRGHDVEVWEKAARPGGQIHLAVAAPDKEEVRPLWTARWDQAIAAGVRVRCGVEPTAAAIRAYAPDHVVIATGARPRPYALPGAAPMQAWDVIADPTLVPEGAGVAVIGGGIVGLEAAEMLSLRGCRITVLEAMGAIAPAMARNNRTDIMIRLRAAGAVFHTGARAERLEDGVLHGVMGGEALRLDGITHVIAAVGALPNREPLDAVEASGMPHTLVGDANQPGDYLSVLRDAWMVGLALGLRPAAATPKEDAA